MGDPAQNPPSTPRQIADRLSAAIRGTDPNDGTGARQPAEPGLYVAALPIGNAEDVTVRVLRLLAAVDLIACEDTRVTRPLLGRYGIETAVTAYHDHNAAKVRPQILARLAAGASVALVSDAGTPLISDPGLKLVREARSQDVPVTCLPGPTAVTTALVLAGMPTDRFLFAGFLPSRPPARRAALTELASVPASLVVFESAGRLPDSLADMAAVLGDRPVAVTREMTKRFEQVREGRLADLAAAYAEAGPPKGEVVVVVGPPDAASTAVSDPALDEALAAALANATLRDAVASVAAETGAPRRRVYQRALALEARRRDDGR